MEGKPGQAPRGCGDSGSRTQGHEAWLPSLRCPAPEDFWAESLQVPPCLPVLSQRGSRLLQPLAFTVQVRLPGEPRVRVRGIPEKCHPPSQPWRLYHLLWGASSVALLHPGSARLSPQGPTPLPVLTTLFAQSFGWYPQITTSLRAGSPFLFIFTPQNLLHGS